MQGLRVAASGSPKGVEVSSRQVTLVKIALVSSEEDLSVVLVDLGGEDMPEAGAVVAQRKCTSVESAAVRPIANACVIVEAAFRRPSHR